MSLPFSQACENNKNPILPVLTTAFADCTQVLEVGSGTGQHAVHFAHNLSHLCWQASDQNDYLHGLQARIKAEGIAGQPLAVEFNVFNQAPDGGYDALFTANTCHIMPTEGVQRLFQHLGDTLRGVKKVCIYGPFNYAGNFTSDSNKAFDELLRTREPDMGIRDIEWIISLAQAQGFKLVNDHDMPANNRLLEFSR
ncbi:Protein of unknown function [Pseudidiomarina planktonica]|uniref:DUF938 domain-containing protein n=1 Tax=Pseudidiomarina planktonica TaxID=1323738 RepID=A0A1Y6EW11_9GAMM|nr:DUF938 domain-containing protein [Pseudidiomarina planktonica]RUO65123.1 DUF938 domain-containing protein [Pseudidiomarina planktonica]SMQ66399.1 Protein of unknown function [Pseudidiomarina planktonica]